MRLKRILRAQSNKQNKLDCKSVLKSLDEASKAGEYKKTTQLKTNQAHYIESLGLNIKKLDKLFFYEISWENEK